MRSGATRKRRGRGRDATEAGDLVSFGVGWGKPGNSSLYDQYTTELSYRIQLAQNFAATPEVQLIIKPALNPYEDVLGFFGIWARLAF